MSLIIISHLQEILIDCSASALVRETATLLNRQWYKVFHVCEVKMTAYPAQKVYLTKKQQNVTCY
jgi:hypothetical protein